MAEGTKKYELFVSNNMLASYLTFDIMKREYMGILRNKVKICNKIKEAAKEAVIHNMQRSGMEVKYGSYRNYEGKL